MTRRGYIIARRSETRMSGKLLHCDWSFLTQPNLRRRPLVFGCRTDAAVMDIRTAYAFVDMYIRHMAQMGGADAVRIHIEPLVPGVGKKVHVVTVRRHASRGLLANKTEYFIAESRATCRR